MSEIVGLFKVLLPSLFIWFMFGKSLVKDLVGGKPPAQSRFKPSQRQVELEFQTLNPCFQYRNQNYDAYEVLGLPAGSSSVDCERVYWQKKKNINPKSEKILDEAFDLVSKKQIT